MTDNSGLAHLFLCIKKMATIRKGGKGWQALIRKKNHIGARSKTFASKAQEELLAQAVEQSIRATDLI